MASLPPQTLYELLEHNAVLAPDQQAVVTLHERMTYEEWRQRSARIGAGLASRGIGHGDSVALLADNGMAWLEVAMGAASVGARVVALNTWAKAWDLEYMIGHAQPRILFAVDHIGKQNFLSHLGQILPELSDQPAGRWVSDRFPNLATVVIIGDDVPLGAESFADWAVTPVCESVKSVVAPDDIAFVMFTSGSTARAKAVTLAHGDLIENGFHIGERQELTADDRVFLASPLFWAYGGGNALVAAMTHRSTLVLQSQFRAAEALTLLERERCTSIYTLPAMTHAIFEDPHFTPERLASVRTGLTIGPPPEIQLVMEGLGVPGICNIYGSSETYGNCCVTPTDAPLERRMHSQGPPLTGVHVKIVDVDTGAPLAAGEVGDILVRGRITPGYLNKMGVPVSVVDGDGFYPTGDLGRMDVEGWLTYEGRSSEMIKTAGINVSPAEIENFLAIHPDVVEAAVAGGEHPVRGQEVIAFVQLQPQTATTVEALLGYCRERIAGYKVPTVIRAVDEFPLTDTGKLARKELKRWADAVVAEPPADAQR